MRQFIGLVACLVVVSAVPTRYNAKYDQRNDCGYKSCPQADPNKLNVHLVPHSHDDVGWLKTVDQYYWGSRSDIQHAGVQYIIDSVVTALLANPERRFIQVESAFFYQWWERQSEERREDFRRLVNNGQLEMVGGAWSMNDEAAVHYHSVIDQFTYGLRVINDTLGECGRPKIGWQIDPFGHSKEMASIFSQMGFDGLFFARLDWRDKSTRLNTKTAEMLWQGSKTLGDKTNLFTSVLYNHYSAPAGFCFDVNCSDEPIIDDENSADYNYQSKVEGFASFIKNQSNNYKTNNIIITMGDDFNYQNALSYFTNMDKLVRGFKIFEQTYNDMPINLFYSTPSCYVKAVNEQAAAEEMSFALKTDDFFPYASDPHAYWTGYFTSRPTSKRFERQGNNLLQITKQISNFVTQDQDDIAEIVSLQQAMGIMQHHDAITGTEKQHVADDYARIVTEAVERSVNKVNDVLSVLLPKDPAQNINLDLNTCLNANVSICQQSQSGNFIAAIYNPLSRKVSHHVRLPVNSLSFSIVGPNDEPIPYLILPSIDSFQHLNERNPASYELVFLAEDLPPMGVKLYKITTTNSRESIPVADTSDQRFRIGNEIHGFELDESTGLLKSISIDGTTLNVKQELMYYIGARGDNMDFESRASGAYIFRPSVSEPTALPIADEVTVTTYRGDLVEEVHQVFNGWAKQIIRLNKNTKYIEFDWLVGSIDISDDKDREVISRFTTDLNSGDVFYTDSNGREMVERKRDHRGTYDFSIPDGEPVAGNYYPVTSKIVLDDNDRNLQFAVLNDRAQGGSSLASGQIELMMHRRLLDDDAFGVGEALNEQQYGQGLVARGQHYVTFGPKSVTDARTSAAEQRDLAHRKTLAPWTFLTENVDQWNDLNHEFSGLTASLPENVQILTLEPWRASDNTLLLRLEHTFAEGEDPNLSQDVTVDLDGLFTYFDVVSIQETTLAGNQKLEENQRLDWIIGNNLNVSQNTLPVGRKYKDKKVVQDPRDTNITLSPMQIRTLLVTVSRK